MTDAFEAVAQRLFKSLGYPDVPILVTPNPVIYLTESQINERVDALLGKIVASFEAAPARAVND